MVYDLSQVETKDFRLCKVCGAERRDLDKFCRRCGTRLVTSDGMQSAGAAPSSAHATSSFQQDTHTLVSSRLVATVARGISIHVAPFHNCLFKWLISALLSIPIWLIIVLFSPFDAYTTAKTLSKQI